MITAARRFESEILRAGLAGEGSHFDTKTTGFLLHLVALVFDAGLPAQRRLVNIEPRYNIAPTDFCRVKSQGLTGSIPIVSTIQSYETANLGAHSR